MTASSPLVLGGHSFISQLGSDTMATEGEQRAIVEACLNSGITWFDTTYQPERIALGRVLGELGRHDEATIIAWNFFTDFGTKGGVGGTDYYQPHHIDVMCEQLRTEKIECLVVHRGSDERENERQLALACSWQEQGRVGTIGAWAPGVDVAESYGSNSPCTFMVKPYNVSTPDAPAVFAACKGLGWLNLACSPYVRGWDLDKMVTTVCERDAANEDETRVRLADGMLRYSLYADSVDRLIVSMRKSEWVAANAASADAGPLTEKEHAWLMSAVSAE